MECFSNIELFRTCGIVLNRVISWKYGFLFPGGCKIENKSFLAKWKKYLINRKAFDAGVLCLLFKSEFKLSIELASKLWRLFFFFLTQKRKENIPINIFPLKIEISVKIIFCVCFFPLWVIVWRDCSKTEHFRNQVVVYFAPRSEIGRWSQTYREIYEIFREKNNGKKKMRYFILNSYILTLAQNDLKKDENR